MKIVKIASVAIMAVLASFMVSCAKEEQKQQEPEKEVTFSVELNLTEADYAEVVVRHDGAESDKWYGFVTTDLTTPEKDLIAAQISQVDKKKLHVGKVQTVAVRSLEAHENYRYVAFGVKEDGSAYGKAGSLTFCTSPVLKVIFSAEAGELEPHKASFNVSHDGIDVLTYMAFLTDDVTSEVATLASKDFAKNVTGGKLNEGVTLLSGSPKAYSFDELLHESAYRLVVYGIFVNNGVAVYYGTPAEAKITTPVDLDMVNFSASASDLTKNSAKVAVSYDAKQKDLTWYGFYTTDLTTDTPTLVSHKAQSVVASDYQSGAKTVELTELTPETDYRYIAFGITSKGVYGTPAEVKFTTLTAAYDNTVFTVEAKDITPYTVTFTITHTGWDEFEYAGFFTEDMQSPVASVALPSNIDSDLMTGKEKTFKVENLKSLTKYRYIVVGRVNGNEYGTRGEVVFTTGDPSVPASYDDFLGAWAITVGTAYEFSIAADVEGQSYIISGLGGATVCKYGIDTPIKAKADFVDGKLVLKSQAISGVYEDASDNKSYTDKLCGLYVSATNGNTYYDNNMGLVLATFALLEDGTVELRPGVTKDDEPYVNFRHFQVPEGGGTAYYQDAVSTALPNIIKRAQQASEAYLKWIGKWNIGGTEYTIAKGETNISYTMGSFYSGFTVNAPVYFDEATGNILFTFGPTGQSVTGGESTPYDLYSAGLTDTQVYRGDDNGVIARFTLSANGNSADVDPVSSGGVTPAKIGILGYNETAGWANFGMTIDIPFTMTRVQVGSSVPQVAGNGMVALKRVKEASRYSCVK